MPLRQRLPQAEIRLQSRGAGFIGKVGRAAVERFNLGRDRPVLYALILCALWSTALIGASGLAARRAPPVGMLRWLHMGLLVSANLALFYAVCNRAQLIDSLFFTVAP